MLLANKEAVMTVLDTLNVVVFNPLQNTTPIGICRRKLIAKIDEKIQLAANKDFTPIRPQPPLPNQQDDRDKRRAIAKSGRFVAV